MRKKFSIENENMVKLVIVYMCYIGGLNQSFDKTKILWKTNLLLINYWLLQQRLSNISIYLFIRVKNKDKLVYFEKKKKKLFSNIVK